MNTADIEAIEERLRAATPGPWHGDHGEFGCVSIGDLGWVAPGPLEYGVDSEQGKADAELVAHAPADIAALLADVKRCRSRWTHIVTLPDARQA